MKQAILTNLAPAREGDVNWVKSFSSLVLAVPSVIIPEEFNYLINPKHPSFTKLKIDPPNDFTFDHRLFK